MTSFSISVQRYVCDVSFDDTGYKNNKYKVETCWRFFVSKLILHFVHNVSCLDIKLGSVPGLIVYFYKIRTIQVSIIGFMIAPLENIVESHFTIPFWECI